MMGAILVAFAFLQSAAQLTVEVDAEFRMLSTIQPGLPTINVWDYFHRVVRSFDLPQKIRKFGNRVYF